MTSKMGKYTGDQLFHEISRDNIPTTINAMYFTRHKTEATEVLNIVPCIIYELILVNPKDFITRSRIKRANMGIWDK